jgi:hypothetical protein
MRIGCKQSTAFLYRNARSGFTVLEVLIASLVGAVIFLALFAGMNQGFNIIQHQRDSLRATEILVNKIEGIRLCAWGNNTATNQTQLFNSSIVPATFTDYFYPLGLGSFPASNVVYNGTITVQGTNFNFYNSSGANTTSPAYCTNMAEVTVTVSWNEVNNGRTNTYSRSMETYFSQYGLQNYIAK